MPRIVRKDGRIENTKYEFAHDDKGNILPTIKATYRCAIIDTVNALQNEAYRAMNEDKRTTLDEWRDFGWEVYQLYNKIKKLEDVFLVQVLGYEGTGKTVGGKTLNPDETVWINADGKPLSFFGARNMYPVDNSRKNYKVTDDYETVLTNINAIHKKRKGILIVFILGHIEDYKGEAGGIRQRLKVLGKQATKLGIEGLNVHSTYYTKIDSTVPINDVKRYKLTVNNSGSNTARSPEGYWETGEIPNDYQLIVDRILEDYGELEPKNS